ncbi:hypothetical protein RNJ44_04537 [Nakaseomyces bracarensis]|uniref:C2H2-type domain-containing protein n=1 Tax=Nakaseomyces bracarensis TaxID=273131 RepID=A0ABR4NVK1_9SACH
MSNFGRRTWDREQHNNAAEKSHLEELREKLNDSQIQQLKDRYTNYDGLLKKSMSGLNKRVLVANVSSYKKGHQFGFYCDLCDMTFKDTLQYVDHLNHKIHELKFESFFGEPLICEQRDNDDIPIDEFKKCYTEEMKAFVKAHKVREIEETKVRKKKKNGKNNTSTGNTPSNMDQMMGFSSFGKK